MKVEEPDLIDSKGIPGNYRLEAKYDRTNRYGIFGNNREEPDQVTPNKEDDKFYVHPPNNYF